MASKSGLYTLTMVRRTIDGYADGTPIVLHFTKFGLAKDRAEREAGRQLAWERNARNDSVKADSDDTTYYVTALLVEA